MKLICRFRSELGHKTIWSAKTKSPREFEALISKIAKIVRAKPVRHLQPEGNHFLFSPGSKGELLVKPGVLSSFRRFKPLIDHLCKELWVSFVRSLHANRAALGQQGDLASFLFGSIRSCLLEVDRQLTELEGRHCFFCSTGSAKLEVDHSIPFSLYGRDLVHNLVLACRKCNATKSNHLAARAHLEKWLNRCQAIGSALIQIGDQAGVRASLDATLQVARWAYGSSTSGVAKDAWVSGNTFEVITPSYSEVIERLAQ